MLKIICARPGLRRAGVAHPAIKTWPDGAFTADQIALLQADPAITVESAEEGEITVPSGAVLPTVEGVLRLLLQGTPTDALVAEMTRAASEALARGESPAVFRETATAIFEAHAYAPASPPAEEAPVSAEEAAAPAEEAPAAEEQPAAAKKTRTAKSTS